MAIFGRSKKNKQQQPSASQPQSGPPSALTYPSQVNLQGPYGSPPQGWQNNQQSPDAAQIYGNGGHQFQASAIWLAPQNQPIHITQNLYLTPPRPGKPMKLGKSISKLNLSSMSNLLEQSVPLGQYLDQGTALYDSISTKFDNVITLIDGDTFSGDERELAVAEAPQPMWPQEEESDRALSNIKSTGMVNNPISSALTSRNYFEKANLYANSRLPPNLPPLKLYVPTYKYLCVAAQYSERVYSKPQGQERETHVDSHWGTKAFTIKSLPMDDMNTIVFAIRGTQSFKDWAVNVQSAPTAPEGFLDDTGNLCHAGFLNVARKMVKTVAARLRHLLQENPDRTKYSLLITGHSAGGAVASLLYCHMLSTSPEAKSELNSLTSYFKRIHCVSFGAPPVSLLPLTKPSDPSLQKSLFMSFVNEGDPVARADPAYVLSLLVLYRSPAPGQSCVSSLAPQNLLKEAKSSSSLAIDKMKIRPKPKKSKSDPVQAVPPIWRVPEATLSNAGRLVLLRSVQGFEGKSSRGKRERERMNEGVVAQVISDELLRGVVFGDPVCHMMTLYARRIEVLATNAIVGRS